MTNPYGPPGGPPPQWGQPPRYGQQGQPPQPGQPGYAPPGRPPGYGGPPQQQQPQQPRPQQQPGYGGPPQQQQPWGQPPGYGPPPPYGRQPGQQPGQWGQPGYGQQPPRKPRGSAKPWLLAGGGVLVVAVLAVLLFAWPGWLNTTVFDRDQMQHDVHDVLANQYKIQDVGDDVSCPADEPVAEGNTFTCSVTVGGQPKKVTITVKDESSARYEVSQPR